MLLELSYPISENIPVYPGSPKEKFLPINRMVAGDPCNTTVITHYIHNGTHVDAPFHFDKDGKDISQIPIEDFCFAKPVIIECKLSKSGLITKEHITQNTESNDADILLFNTGYAALRDDTNTYCDDFPSLSLEAAEYIRNELSQVKGIAIDVLSIESAVAGPAKDFPVHKMLLDHQISPHRTLLVFEDVNVSKAVNTQIQRIYAFPLRLEGIDGSPVTIVAEVRND